MWQMLKKLFGWNTTVPSGHVLTDVPVAEVEVVLTLEQIKLEILTMKKGERRSLVLSDRRSFSWESCFMTSFLVKVLPQDPQVTREVLQYLHPYSEYYSLPA